VPGGSPDSYFMAVRSAGEPGQAAFIGIQNAVFEAYVAGILVVGFGNADFGFKNRVLADGDVSVWHVFVSFVNFV